MANAYGRLRREATPGNENSTPTYGSKILYPPATQIQMNLNPAPLDRTDELRGIDEPLTLLPETFRPDYSMAGRMHPDSVGMLLTCMLGLPTTTAGNGVITDPDSVAIPVGAYRHVWTAPFGTGLTPQTFDLLAAYKDQTVFYQQKGCAIQQFGISVPESGGAQYQVSGPALYMARITDPALTPTYEALTVAPFMRRHLTLSWLSGSATTEDFSLNIANPVVASFTMGQASSYPDLIEKDEAPIMFTGSIPKRVIDLDDYDALLAATGFAATVKFVSQTIIASAYPYKLYFAFTNCQYAGGGPGALENRRRIGASFDWRASTTGSAGHATITLVNATTSYS